MECPKCKYDLGPDYEPYFTCEESGSGFNHTFGIKEFWWSGYIKCPECNHKWDCSDSSL